MPEKYVYLKNLSNEVIYPRTKLEAVDLTETNGIVVSASTIGIMDGYVQSAYYTEMIEPTTAANPDSAYIDGGTMFTLIGGYTVTDEIPPAGDASHERIPSEYAVRSAIGASAMPVLYASRINVNTSAVTPGKTKTVITQASTANPYIIRCIQSGGNWVWDTTHAEDIEDVYGKAWQNALYIETETGRMWTVSTNDNHLEPVTMGTYTQLIVMTETFGGSGWQYAVTGSNDAPTPVANGRCLIMTTETNSGTGVTTVRPLWCLAVSDGQGGYTWDTTNPVPADVDLSSSHIYYATATGRLYMYINGNSSLTRIASPGAGGGSSNLTFENFGDGTTYPDPTEWAPGE